jgi:hypothetical protein
MAGDSKRFDVEIGTKADTSGLEAAERGLRAVETAGRAAANPMADGSQAAAVVQRKEVVDLTWEQAAAIDHVRDAEEAAAKSAETAAEATRKADVDKAQGLKRIREEATRAAAETEKILQQQRLQGIGRELQNLAVQVRAFAAEFAATEEGQEMLAGVNGQLRETVGLVGSITSGAATGGAMGGIWGALIGGGAALVTEFKDAFTATTRQVIQSNAELEAATVANFQRMEAKRKATATDEIRTKYKEETDELARQREELERIAELRGLQADLGRAKDALADQRALNAGANPDAIRIENIGQRANEEIAARGAALKTEQDKLLTLQDDLAIAQMSYREQVKATGKQSDEAKQALARISELEGSETSQQALVNKLQEQLAVRDATTVAEFQTKAEAEGGKLLENLAAAAEKVSAKTDAAALQKILEDGVVTPDEVGALIAAAQQLTASNQAKDAETLKALQTIATDGEVYLNSLGAVQRQLDEQGNRLRILEAQRRTPASG